RDFRLMERSHRNCTVVSQPDVEPLLTTLQQSIFASDRERAAHMLGQVDWWSNTPVVDALLTASRTDDSPTVRRACICSLARIIILPLQPAQDESYHYWGWK